MKSILPVLFAAALAAVAQGNKRLQLAQLPQAVQKTINENLMGAQIKNIDKEKEDGVEQYEIESMLNGKARDFDVDVKGNLLVVEVATSIDAIPAAAKASILRKVAGGKLGTVETFTKTGQPMMYEAAYTAKNGKKHEVLVKADGTETKE